MGSGGSECWPECVVACCLSVVMHIHSIMVLPAPPPPLFLGCMWPSRIAVREQAFSQPTYTAPIWRSHTHTSLPPLYASDGDKGEVIGVRLYLKAREQESQRTDLDALFLQEHFLAIEETKTDPESESELESASSSDSNAMENEQEMLPKEEHACVRRLCLPCP